MNTFSSAAREATGFELCFHSLTHADQGYSFPCDEAGHVDIDSLGTRARLNYFYARTVIGREFSLPAVEPRTLH